jgi:hypothetical protein
MAKRLMVLCGLLMAIGLVASVPVLAHTPLLAVEDNFDGTIYLTGGFSDGSSAGGVTILLVENEPYEAGAGSEESEEVDLYAGKLVLLRTQLDEYSELTLDKPEVDYLVILDAGPGHVVEVEGPPLTDEEEEFLAAE